uniref:Uncharacterized protein n=1 Tax=Rhizophora mucronata TaxID=61149 RepID=A0A2P2MXY1_RHIMU
MAFFLTVEFLDDLAKILKPSCIYWFLFPISMNRKRRVRNINVVCRHATLSFIAQQEKSCNWCSHILCTHNVLQSVEV